jgi:hypothetical protein
MLDAVPAIGNGRRSYPRGRPAKIHADKGCDFTRCRRVWAARRIKHHIVRIGLESKARLGRYRWVVERKFAWLAQYRRLSVRYERRAETHRVVLMLGCSAARLLGCSAARRHGGTAARRHGRTAARRHGGAAARRRGCAAARGHGGAAARRHGRTAARRHGGTAARPHGGTAAWRHGGAAARLEGLEA